MILNENNIAFLKSQSKRRITLNEYVKAYYDANILPYDNALDNVIQKSCARVFEITKAAYNNPSHEFYYSYDKRINEYGNHVENVLCAAIEEITGNSAKNLGVGYPDVRTKIFDYNIYPECKICADIDDVGSMRSFYTTTPAERTKKIKDLHDGIHLLFKFEHDGPGKLTGRYKIWDLNGLEYTAEGSLQQGNAKDIDTHCKVVMDYE
jgi:hypothetical protein